MGKLVTFRTWQAMQSETPSAADVRELRAALGFSQQAFATFLGISIGAVRKWEQGEREPTGLYRQRLLDLIADQDRYRALKRA